jgi:hypothetical protein
MNGWSIEIPLGWTTVIAGDRASLRLFLDAELKHDESSASVTTSGIELSVRQTTREHADNVMRWHVVSGEPDVSTRRLGGRDTQALAWTNGVQNIETMFVETPDAQLLRVDVVTPVYANEIATRGRAAADVVLDSFAWR